MPASVAISAIVAASRPFLENTLAAASRMLWRRASRWASVTFAIVVLVRLQREVRVQVQSTARGAECAFELLDAGDLGVLHALGDLALVDLQVDDVGVCDCFEHFRF